MLLFPIDRVGFDVLGFARSVRQEGRAMSAPVDRVSARDTRGSDLRSSEGVLIAFVLMLPFRAVVAYLFAG